MDGIGNCLLQPGHIRNQLHKSMLSTSFYLLNLVYPDSSCCRDKVSRAAGQRAVGSVFCSPFRKIILARNFVPSTGTHTQAGSALTRNFADISTGTGKKLANPDTDGH